MSWLKYPEKLFSSNVKIKSNTKKTFKDSNLLVKKENTADINNKDNNCTKSIIYGETSKQQLNANTNVSENANNKPTEIYVSVSGVTNPTNAILKKRKVDNKECEDNNSELDHVTILNKRKLGKPEYEDTNNSGTINGSVLSVKDPTSQLKPKENTSSDIKVRNVNAPTFSILNKGKTARKRTRRKNGLPVEDISWNLLESRKHASSETKPKEVNLPPDNNAILKIEETGKKEEKGINNTQTMSTTVSLLKDPPNPLESKENTSSGSKPKEVNFPTDNSTTSKKETPDKKENGKKNNSGTIDNDNVLSVKDPTNQLESKENTSSDTKAKEVNLPTDNNPTLKKEKTGKEEEKGKQNTQTKSITICFRKRSRKSVGVKSKLLRLVVNLRR
ncbi:unnamed protein product [Diabrotica balteata]|uniref:Uncharacterized protein n=1 Tax=Diabrotica balteata TaxID=107213 RepID=A0A9N9XBX2_DIABA|nr:unnamed protein product [Diabrotica balteata]